MSFARLACAVSVACVTGLAALAQDGDKLGDPAQQFSTVESDANPFGPLLPRNRPTDLHGIQAVCTGVDEDSRKDPRWAAYPLKLEFAAKNGEYLAFAQVTVKDAKGQMVLSVRCPGAWLLLGLPPGEYKAMVAVPDAPPQTVTVAVPKSGQKSMVLHFPKPPDGGDVSPERGPN
jgi:hypothetical protein